MKKQEKMKEEEREEEMRTEVVYEGREGTLRRRGEVAVQQILSHPEPDQPN